MFANIKISGVQTLVLIFKKTNYENTDKRRGNRQGKKE